MTLINMSCLGVILVRGRDGMSTPQNGAAAYCLAYHISARVVSCCLVCGFRLPACPSAMV